jgi:hypothetical protein
VWKCDVCDGNGDAWGAGEAKFLREKKRSCKIVSEFYFSVFPFLYFSFFLLEEEDGPNNLASLNLQDAIHVLREREREREEFYFSASFSQVIVAAVLLLV